MNPITYAVNLIKHFEGCRLSSYQDSGGVWTIGYGHTKGVVAGQTCTQEQAGAWLVDDLAPLIAATAGLPPLKTIAYLDFGYNCGLGALERLIAGHIYLTSYGRRDARGAEVPGLVARRNVEICLIAMEG